MLTWSGPFVCHNAAGSRIVLCLTLYTEDLLRVVPPMRGRSESTGSFGGT